jgi:hypothetical protein
MSLRFILTSSLLLLATLAEPASAKEAASFNFPDQAQAGGQPVSLVGVGVRTKWMVDVYGMGVYQKTVKKTGEWLVRSDEPKQLWLHMARSIGAEKMRDAIEEGVAKNTPEAERAPLAADLDKLKQMFPATISKGTDILFVYVPGKGTTLRIGQTDKLTVAGTPFMRAIWRIWFGRSPADTGLADSVLGR